VTGGTRFAAVPRFGLFAEEHDELRAAVRRFVERELAPGVEAWERAGEFPHRRVFEAAGSLGLFGAKVGPADGGTGPDPVADAVITEELARCGSGGVAASLGAHKDLAVLHLVRFADEEIRRRWLPPALSGERIGALAVTEPGGGSDVAALGTTAEWDGDSWRLSGEKAFVTNGPIADFVVVAARSRPGDGHRGISLFVVDAAEERSRARLTATRIPTLGWRTSQTGQLSLDGAAGSLLGEEHGGFAHLAQNFQWERLAMALAAVAAADRTLALAEAYAAERSAFGRPVGSFQVWRHRFADLSAEIEAARSLTYHALRTVAAGEDAAREVAMAKWLATELDWRVADEALQVHGGWGYMSEFPVQRAWRDARLGPIGGGTTEVMKEIVGRSFGL
jgi:acyl-CoA dehydrogenase